MQGTQDPEPAAALFFDLVRCETRLYNAMNDRLRETHGIVTSQFEILRFVRDHPGTRVVDLATEFAAGVGAMSKGVDRLAERGLLRRAINPADRRSALLVLSESGEELVGEAERTFEALVAVLLMPALGGDGGAAVARVLAALRSSLERDAIGRPAG